MFTDLLRYGQSRFPFGFGVKKYQNSTLQVVFTIFSLQKPLTDLNPTPHSPRNNKATDATADAKVKKMSLIMEIMKQFRSLRLGINISIVLVLVGLSAIIGLIIGAGSTFTTILAVYLGYRLLMLILRTIRLIFSLLFSVASIVILIVILSFLI